MSFPLNVSPFFTENCMPLPMKDLDTVQMIKKIVPVHGICVNKVAVPNFMECFGTCNSGTKYNKVTGSFDKQCECCSIRELTNIPVELTCLDNYKLKMDVAVPKVCGCTACAEQLEEQLPSAQKLLQTKTKSKY